MGELSDKATQSEIDELEGSISSAEANRNQPSIVKDLLNALPSGLFGGKDESGKVDELQQNANNAQMQNMRITPKSPEEFTRQAELIREQIYPALEFHDEVMRSINEAVEKIPVLPEMLDQLSEAMSIFVFSLIAPVVLPLIKQIKAELSTGSSEVIASSREKQLVVFKDDESTDPTHSMISKDHFSNVLNEPAGKVASQVLKWVVPQIVECWDDENVDAERNINRIINGVFHHPALRDEGEDGARDCHQQMFQVVEGWWRGLDERERRELRSQLSRDGVEQGKNHKEGVHDSGHGCGKPLGPGGAASGASGAIAAGMMGAFNEGLQSQGLGEFARPVTQSQQSGRRNDGQSQDKFGIGKMAGEAAGGGLLGGLVGGLVGGVGSSLLGGAFGGDDSETKSYKQESHGNDGSYTQSYTETGRKPAQGYGGQDQYGQAEYKKTEYSSGGRKEESVPMSPPLPSSTTNSISRYSRYEQDGNDRPQGYGFQQSVETKPSYGGGYERTEERRTERPGGGWESERRTENVSGGGQYSSSESRYVYSQCFDRELMLKLIGATVVVVKMTMTIDQNTTVDASKSTAARKSRVDTVEDKSNLPTAARTSPDMAVSKNHLATDVKNNLVDMEDVDLENMVDVVAMMMTTMTTDESEDMEVENMVDDVVVMTTMTWMSMASVAVATKSAKCWSYLHDKMICETFLVEGGMDEGKRGHDVTLVLRI